MHSPLNRTIMYKRRSKGEPLGDQEWKKKPENREPVQPTMSSLAQRFQRRQTEQNKARYGNQSCRIAAHEEARTTTTKTDDWPHLLRRLVYFYSALDNSCSVQLLPSKTHPERSLLERSSTWKSPQTLICLC